ncbi:MAG: hypothetical protein IPN69_20745 [Acidobacteria bacterium]|nr:hypothetical protein [Acidobacteriota bacterium]MBK8813138.1 hypothetical protein [Acidobacteriota bacterium]
MRYLDSSAPQVTASVWRRLFDEYRRSLNEVADRLPEGVRKFAISDWYYDASDHRCPHDSSVGSVSVTEENGQIAIRLRLFGAFHDGELVFDYKMVSSYQISLRSNQFETKTHSDWAVDEIGLSDDGSVVHEIRFVYGDQWRIECSDIQFAWHPFDESLTNG